MPAPAVGGAVLARPFAVGLSGLVLPARGGLGRRLVALATAVTASAPVRVSGRRRLSGPPLLGRLGLGSARLGGGVFGDVGDLVLEFSQNILRIGSNTVLARELVHKRSEL